jgi:site-specific recombinase
MARTIEVVPPEENKRRGNTTVRRTRVVVRKVGPWSVLRFSLLFYFCVMVAFWLGLLILYGFLGAIGVLDSIERGIRGVGFSKDWSLHAGWIFSRMFMIGLVMVVFGAIVNLFATFIYNVIADFVGGIELTLTERR